MKTDDLMTRIEERLRRKPMNFGEEAVGNMLREALSEIRRLRTPLSSRDEDAILRLTAWIREYGETKQQPFIDDLRAVLRIARSRLLSQSCPHCGDKCDLRSATERS